MPNNVEKVSALMTGWMHTPDGGKPVQELISLLERDSNDPDVSLYPPGSFKWTFDIYSEGTIIHSENGECKSASDLLSTFHTLSVAALNNHGANIGIGCGMHK